MKICPVCKKQYDSTVNICPEDNEILEENLAALVGKTLDGQYLIEKLLGQGGMGAVFRARHTMLGDQVAIKVMPSGISKSSDYQRRFLREAKTARQFSHPNVVAVHDLRTTQDGMFYMVLEYVNGHTLNDELKKRRKFSPKEAVDILNPIGDALTMAHSLGIIHRDLKPDNIMIGKTKDGSMLVKLLDLGIAKVKSVDATALTATGQILGTPHYMSPEQWNSDEIDGRADIYSLGIILYELVAGVRPFSGKTIQKLAYEHSVTTPSLLCKIVSSVSEEFSKVVEKAIEKDPDKRPNGCQELFVELKNALKYEVYNDEDLLQCETLVTSKPIETAGFSSNTTQENQVTLIAKTENTHAESKQVAEKTLNNIATLVNRVENTQADSKIYIGQTQETSKDKLNVSNLQTNKIQKTNETKNFFDEDKTTSKSEVFLTPKNSKPYLVISAVLLVFVLASGVYVWKSQTFINTNTPLINAATPTLSPSNNSIEQIELLRYWLEFTPPRKKETDKIVPINKADIRIIPSDYYFKFHFLPNQSGYLYILGVGKNDLLMNFLSNTPTSDTGLKSNKISLGEKITFPSGVASSGEDRVINLGGTPGKETYTIIFSAQPLTSPNFLNSKPGYELTLKEFAEWEQFRASTQLAKVTIESGNQEVSSLAKVVASKVKPEQPIIFNITFEHN